MYLADYLSQQLLAHQIRDVFAIPGDFVLPWLTRFEQSALTLVQLSHEPSAVFAADAAARFTNQPAAVMLTYGAGALNAINAIAQAYMEFVPLLVFAGYPSKAELASGLTLHHQLEDADGQYRILREITAFQVRLDDAEHAAQAFAQALAICQQQKRPVLIELPRDMACAPLPSPLAHQATEVEPWPIPIELAQALTELLGQATRPCLVIGAKARRFGFADPLADLCQRSQLPCVSTLLGRSVLDPNLPGFAGVFSGANADPLLPFLTDSDVLWFAGVIKSDSNFAGHPELLRHPRAIWWDETGVRLPDGRYFQVASAALCQWLERQSWHYQARSAPVVDETELSDPSAWTSSQVMQLLHQQLALQQQTYPFVVDIGDCLFAALATAPRWLLAPAFYASMGYAVPAALGLQQVSRQRPIVIVGDGAFQMTGLELGHCSRYQWTPIVIVLNNQSWGMIKAFAPGLETTSLSGWNYTALARAMQGGARQAWNAEQFVSALADALADTSRFRLIEVMLPAHSYSECLARFSGALTAPAN